MAEAVRKEQEAKAREFEIAEKEERAALHGLVQKTAKSGPVIAPSGYLMGDGWKEMDSDDIGAAKECEVDINFNERVKEKLPKEGLMVIRYAGKQFSVARHTNGVFRVLGMPDFEQPSSSKTPTAVIEKNQDDGLWD
jgi:hypothetical protein